MRSTHTSVAGRGTFSLLLSKQASNNLKPFSIPCLSLLGICRRCRCGLIPFKVTLYRVEDAVYELSCFERRKPAGYLESFVYHDGLWCVGFIEEFVDRQPENVPVY